MTSSQVQATIVRSILKVSPGAKDLGPETNLIGQHAALDSVGFVTLLVTLEADLAHQVDLSEAFLQHGGTEADSPFRTVATLAAHIEHRLAGRS